MVQRVAAELGIGIGANESAAGIVEIHSAHALGGIIERVAKRGEIRDTAGKAIGRRRTTGGRKLGVDR